MNWEERIRQSDAGKLMPERADEIVAAAIVQDTVEKIKKATDFVKKVSKVDPEFQRKSMTI